jgi:hypothetical protein
MSGKLSPAQRANQITFVLKGDLKNVQISYLRAGSRLAKMRDEKLYRALKYKTIEDYAKEELGLKRSSVFRYLQIYDWVWTSHRGWLAKHPKGFIPELTDAGELMWIEEALENLHLGAETRAALEAMRKKALAGKLTQDEFEEFRRQGEQRHDTLGAIAASLRSIRRRATALGDFPPAALRELDVLLDLLKSVSGALARAVRSANAGGKRLTAVGRRSPRAWTGPRMRPASRPRNPTRIRRRRRGSRRRRR